MTEKEIRILDEKVRMQDEEIRIPNGKIRTPDNGYFYGIGAFETMAVENGNIEFLNLHLARLQKALDFFQISFSPDQLKQDIDMFMRNNLASFTGHDVLKLTISEKEQHMSIRENTYFRYGLKGCASSLDPEKNIYQKGFQVEISSILRNETSPLTYHKTLCYADNLLEKQRIQKAGKEEVLFLNSKGEVTEGSTSNIFFVKGEKLYTPPVFCGLLPGVIRGYICSKTKVTEQVIHPGDLSSFEGAFLTNSLMKIMPVQCIGDIRYSIETSEKFNKLLTT